jgi:hypothetical protein
MLDTMSNLRTTPDGAKRIGAAHETYVVALRDFNSVRCTKPSCGSDPDYAARVNEAKRRVDEALAEWIALFQRETGRKLAIAC